MLNEGLSQKHPSGWWHAPTNPDRLELPPAVDYSDKFPRPAFTGKHAEGRPSKWCHQHLDAYDVPIRFYCLFLTNSWRDTNINIGTRLYDAPPPRPAL